MKTYCYVFNGWFFLFRFRFFLNVIHTYTRGDWSPDLVHCDTHALTTTPM